MITHTNVTHLGASDGTSTVCSSAVTIGAGLPDHLSKITGDSIIAQIGCNQSKCGFAPISAQILDRYNNLIQSSTLQLVLVNLLGFDAFGPKRLSATSAASGTFTFSTHLGYNGVQDLWTVRPNGFTLPDLAVTGNTQLFFSENTKALGNGSFNAKVDLVTGAYPADVAVGDFRETGNLDLAVANRAANTLNFFLSPSVADGTFTLSGSPAITSSTAPMTIIVGDFNQDGHLDMAVALLNSGVNIYLGNGNGTFSTPVYYPVVAPLLSAVSGDLDGDGYPDLVLARGMFSSQITVMLGKGDGTFQSPVNYTAALDTLRTRLADLNHDGILDTAVTNYGANSVSILLGNGDGTFKTHVDYPLGVAPSDVAIADFNQDGNLDLAVTSSNGNAISVLLGNGNGTFQTKVDYATGGADHPTTIRIGDVNGDSIPDLIAVYQNSSAVGIFTGKGDGTFNASYKLTSGTVPFGLALGDFNQDGKLDIVTTNSTANTISVLIGK